MQIPPSHNKIRILPNSDYVGRVDPVTRTPLCLDEVVIECKTSGEGEVVSLASWKELDKCPFCYAPTGIKTTPIEEETTDTKKAQYGSGRWDFNNMIAGALATVLLITCLGVLGMSVHSSLNSPGADATVVSRNPWTTEPVSNTQHPTNDLIVVSNTPWVTEPGPATPRSTIELITVPQPTIKLSSTPAATKTVYCPGAFPTRLNVGDKARIVTYQVNVRSGPDTNHSVSNRLSPGREITILDGPECNDGQLWYYVISEQIVSGGKIIRVEGWVVEESGDHWFIEPIE